MRSWRPTSAMRITASTGIFRMSVIISMVAVCPTDTCGSKNCASDAASTMSASATQWNAPPAHKPFTAVMTGFHTPCCHDVKCRSQASTDAWYRCMPMPSVAISATSTPVWNARPSPVCTITRTAGSESSSVHASASSSRMRLFIALSCSGRLKINHPTGPFRSTFSVSYVAIRSLATSPLASRRRPRDLPPDPGDPRARRDPALPRDTRP